VGPREETTPSFAIGALFALVAVRGARRRKKIAE
jgi:hypothetical protein